MKYELYHHGILGQKWGIRRFQNEDGSLTAAGKKRYQEGSSFGSKGREIKAKDAAELKSTIQDYKDRGDKETAKILQKHYNNLIKDLDKREVDFGEAWLKIINTRQEINRITNQTYALSGLITNDSSARLRAATIARSAATYNYSDDDYRTAVANYKELSRQIKQGRREQRNPKIKAVQNQAAVVGRTFKSSAKQLAPIGREFKNAAKTVIEEQKKKRN